MKTVSLPDGRQVPALGLGTWGIGDEPDKRTSELAAIRHALDNGVCLIDTAEMYGEGKSEDLIGEALAGRRDEAFLVSKVYPHNAGTRQMQAACDGSLRRLRTDRIDLYLLHWRGSVPLEEVIDGFLRLRQAGKIRYFGVSNLDRSDMQELWRIKEARATAANQVLYNLTRRGIEWDLLPWCRGQQMPVMAYSPIEQGRLLRNQALRSFAQENGWTSAQVALAWLLHQNGVIAIPKTGRKERVDENVRALDVQLSPSHLRELDRYFPPPKGATPLEMI